MISRPAIVLLLPAMAALAWSPSSPRLNVPHRMTTRPIKSTISITSSSSLYASSKSSHQPSTYRHNPVGRLLTSKKQKRVKETPSALHNIVEDGLDIEIDEIEAELRVKKAIKLRLEKIKDAQDEVREQQREPPPMKVKDAASIIAGTAIGGGFLALPSVTSPIGYGPTALGLLASWGFLALSAVAFIEAAGLVSDARSRKEKSISSSTDTAVAEDNEYDDDEETEAGLAISSIIRVAFGKKWGIISGLAFIAQMVAVMTIQVVKGAAITSQITGMPYALGCVVPSVVASLFVFLARPEVVEGANTSLTTMMIGGFALLCLAAVTVGNGNATTVASSTISPFARADWASLLPSTRVTWSIPVLMKLLAWGEAMPLLTERVVETTAKSTSAVNGHTASNVNGDMNDSIAVRATAQKKARKATTLGSSVPLLLCLLWAAISTALVDPTSPDPITFLLAASPVISIPVGLLSIGAIGTTLLASFLAMSHFASDVICTMVGYCDLRWMNIARILTVAVPCVCAFAGPGLYLPLLTFAGAYPTTLLYGLAPPLAALVLRHRAKKEGVQTSQLTPSLVPGGKTTLALLVATSIGIVGSCSALALRSLLKSVGV